MESPRERAAATKRTRTIRAIRKAARTLFDERGWGGVQREDVAEEADVGVATLHRYYPSKRALVIGAYASPLAVLVEQAEEDITRDALDTFIHRLATILADHPALAVAYEEAARQDDKDLGDVSFNRLVEVLTVLIINKTVSLTARPEMEAAEYHLYAMLAWITSNPQRSGDYTAAMVLRQLL